MAVHNFRKATESAIHNKADTNYDENASIVTIVGVIGAGATCIAAQTGIAASSPGEFTIDAGGDTPTNFIFKFAGGQQSLVPVPPA